MSILRQVYIGFRDIQVVCECGVDEKAEAKFGITCVLQPTSAPESLEGKKIPVYGRCGMNYLKSYKNWLEARTGVTWRISRGRMNNSNIRRCICMCYKTYQDAHDLLSTLCLFKSSHTSRLLFTFNPSSPFLAQRYPPLSSHAPTETA